MASHEGSAISGGMLVVLGIIVAVGLGVFFYQYTGGTGDADTNVSVTTPSLNDAAPAAGGNEGNAGTSGSFGGGATGGAGASGNTGGTTGGNQ